MNKHYITLAGLMLLVGLFLFSCNKNTGALKFDKIKLNDTVHLFGDTANPASNFVIEYTYPIKSSDKKLKDSLNNIFLSACLGEKYIGEFPQEAIKLYAENYFDQNRRDLEPMYAENLKDIENKDVIRSWYSYYKNIESKVLFYEKDLLVYSVHLNEYTGGAHGTYTTTYINIDLKNIHILSLNDIFVGEYKEALTDLLWNQLMMDNNVATREELEEMGYGLTGDLIPTENFYLDKEGITFHYNVYEFTPYAMGPTIIKLPFDMILHIIGEENPIIGQLRK
ncbi:RsiV family protein [Bacteroides sp. 224]|uniref:RsiV family protein n=1 Tax=Bacteroides sp. 224 TaxID=2302936 RepID=UPI0013D7F453|nr:RsiV family protein [Bacteroides sp. 224]NDV64505.1 DUF3298 domain-containing protein [Bacteroides sp. 224]